MEKNIKHERIIIDMSIFTNPDVYQTFGASPLMLYVLSWRLLANWMADLLYAPNNLS